MGLFSQPRRLFRTAELRSPIRFHSTYSLASAARGFSRAGRKIRSIGAAATNDARVVGGALVVAAAALAAEMAVSIK